MALDTYVGLKASVADFLNRQDLTSAIPDFITLAESQMMRAFVTRQREGLPIPRRLIRRTDATLTAGSEYAAAPSDYRGARTLNITTDCGPKKVRFVELDTLDTIKSSYRPLPGERPRYYTLVGTELQFFPVPSVDYPMELTYVAALPSLSATNASNWVLTDFPDAYLYGALMQSAPYLKQDTRIQTWSGLFQTAISDICKADVKPPSEAKLRVDRGLLRRSRFFNDFFFDR